MHVHSGLQYAAATAVRSVILRSAPVHLYIMFTFSCERAKPRILWCVTMLKRGFTLSQTLKNYVLQLWCKLENNSCEACAQKPDDDDDDDDDDNIMKFWSYQCRCTLMQKIHGTTKVSHLHVQNISSAPTRMLKRCRRPSTGVCAWKKDRFPVSWQIETCAKLWCDITIQDIKAGLHSKCWMNNRFMKQNSTLLMKQQFVLTHTIHKTVIPTLPDRWVTNTHSCKKLCPT
jgi:hypothetical protein